MEDIVNLIGSDSSASEISDSIKNTLYVLASKKIDAMRPGVSSSMFDNFNSDGEE